MEALGNKSRNLHPRLAPPAIFLANSHASMELQRSSHHRETSHSLARPTSLFLTAPRGYSNRNLQPRMGRLAIRSALMWVYPAIWPLRAHRVPTKSKQAD